MSTVIDFEVSLSSPPTTHMARRRMRVITVCGETDMVTTPLLRARVHEQISRGGPDLIIDLTEVSLLADAGLTVLSAAHRAAVTAGVAFRVVASTRPVLLSLRITGLDGLLACYPELDSARAASPASRFPEPRRPVDELPAAR